MRWTRAVALSYTILAASAQAAPFGGDDCGLVPPDPRSDPGETLRCETQVTKEFAKLLRALLRCDTRTAATAAGGGLSVDDACEDAARAKFDAAVARVAASCPAQCAVRNASSLADWARASLNQRNAQLFCSDGTRVQPSRLHLGVLPGAVECGGPGFVPPPGPPFAGFVESSSGVLANLALGCIYLGGGSQTQGPLSVFLGNDPRTLELASCGDEDALAVVAGDGSGPDTCSRGAGPGRHCLGSGPTTGAPCADDAECGGNPGTCLADANCYLTPPLPAPGIAGVCLVNAYETDITGRVDTQRGSLEYGYDAATRVYLTSAAQPCPRCVAGRCDSGRNQGESCVTTGEFGTSVACLPGDSQFFGTVRERIAVTTGTSVLAADTGGAFCEGQPVAGAFGVPSARKITVVGSPGGDLTDFQPHEVRTVQTTCLVSDNPVINSIVNYPAPLANTAAGTMQLE